MITIRYWNQISETRQSLDLRLSCKQRSQPFSLCGCDCIIWHKCVAISSSCV